MKSGRSALAMTGGLILALMIAGPVPAQDWATTVTNVSTLGDKPNHSPRPVVAMSADGSTVLSAWDARSDGDKLYTRITSLDATGAVSAQGTVSTTLGTTGQVGGYDDAASIALSADGSRAIAVWSSNSGHIYASVATVTSGTLYWSTETQISDGSDSSRVRATLSADGTKAFVAWRGISQAPSTNRLARAIFASISGGGGSSAPTPSWSSITDLSTDGSDIKSGGVSLAASDDGTRAVFAWERPDSSTSVNKIESRMAVVSGGSVSWLGLEEIMDSTGSPSLAVSGDGSTALVTWQASGVSSSRTASLSAGGASWAQSVSMGSAISSQLAISQDGSTAVTVGPSDSDLLAAVATTVAGTTTWGPSSVLWTKPDGISFVERNLRMSDDGLHAVSSWGYDNVVRSATAVIVGDQAGWSAASILPGTGHMEYNTLGLSSDGLVSVSQWWYLPDDRNFNNAMVELAPGYAENAILLPASEAVSAGGTVALPTVSEAGLTVAYASTTPSVCTVSGSTLTLVAGGTCSVTASQAGNGSFSAATDVTQTWTVTGGGGGASSGGASSGGASSGGSSTVPSPETTTPDVNPGVIDQTTVTAEQLQQLSPNELALMPTATFAQLPDAVFAAITPAQFSSLTVEQLAVLPPAGMAALSPEVFRVITRDQVRVLSRAQISALIGGQTSQMSVQATKSIGTTASTRNKYSGSQMQALTAGAVRGFTLKSMATFSRHQLAAINSKAYAAMRPKQVRSIRPVQITRVTGDQLSRWSSRAVKQIRLDTLRKMSSKQAAAFTTRQVRAMSVAQRKALDIASIPTKKKSNQVQRLG